MSGLWLVLLLLLTSFPYGSLWHLPTVSGSWHRAPFLCGWRDPAGYLHKSINSPGGSPGRFCAPLQRLSRQDALDLGYEIDEDSLTPLDEAATPRQAEMHGRLRQKSMSELERYFEDRIAKVAPAMLEALNSGPGAVAVVDNVLGLEWCEAMRQEAISVTERGLLKGSASAYSTAPQENFEERFGDEPGIAATVLPPSTFAGELSPRCNAYIQAASRSLSRALSGARRGLLEPTESPGRPTDHQLRLTIVAQQVHMDNSFDGVNRRLLTTIYYLNPSWKTVHGGRFIPWPCSDTAAAANAREATLASTVLKFDDLPADAQQQIPLNKRYAEFGCMFSESAKTPETLCTSESRKASGRLRAETCMRMRVEERKGETFVQHGTIFAHLTLFLSDVASRYLSCMVQ